MFLYDCEDDYISSDLFLWRTDKGFETVFKASDILRKYYGVDSVLRVIFYDSSGVFIYQKDFKFDDSTLTIEIKGELLNREDIGTFAVFNVPTEQTSKNINVTNRCYVGYGRNGSFSMVHGNIIGVMTSPKGTDRGFHQSITPAISGRKGSYKYVIQKRNDGDKNTSLGFTNPLNRRIYVNVNGNISQINPRGCALITVDTAEDIFEVKSDFIFPRPIVICDDGRFIDCLHG
tara:strand:- start:1429 stop:2124 length:696 start_codon:yes stop_codon:yes gene_type:complete